MLLASISPRSFGRVLAAEPVPPGWIASLIDTQQVFIARNRDPERFIVKPGEDWSRVVRRGERLRMSTSRASRPSTPRTR